MNLKSQIKKIITGLTIPQEYVCLERADLQSPISVFLQLENKKIKLDVTTSHLFLGYKPLIIGLSFNTKDHNYETVRDQDKIFLGFECYLQMKPISLARLTLKKIGEKKLADEVVFFYEGVHGVHSFLSKPNQWINRLREKFRKQSPNNVSLPGNLVDQVRITYSVPRMISIITVSDGTLMNMFPTDLHGSISGKFYAGSLRIGGKANEQVENHKKIVIAEVESAFYKQAYALGKNHMKELQNENTFSLLPTRSKIFDLPLPLSIIQYRELKSVDSFDAGIHRIHLYEVIHHQNVQEGKPSLSHIHQHYAQWRLDQKLHTPMMLR